MADDDDGTKDVALTKSPTGIPSDLLRASEHRIAPSAAAPETPLGVIEATVANGKDIVPVAPDPHSIRVAVESGVPVVMNGDVVVNGTPKPEWISVQGFDAKAHAFVVAEPGKLGSSEWSVDELEKFGSGAHGGDAMEITERPVGAFSEKQIAEIMKVVRPADRAAAATTIPLVLDECTRLGITDHGQIAYILATAEKESNFGRPLYSHSVPLVEDPDPSTNKDPVGYFDKKYGDDGGNRPTVDGRSTNDGYNYRGRGLVQITHRDSYEKASERIGLPDVVVAKEPATSLNIDKEIADERPVPALVARPDLAAREDVAVQTLVQGMRDGWYGSGRPISHYIDGARQNFYDARTMINGHDSAAEIAARAKEYDSAIDRANTRTSTPERHVGLDPAAVRSVDPWNGNPREGTIVSFNDGSIVMHVGLDRYITLDVEKDLGMV